MINFLNQIFSRFLSKNERERLAHIELVRINLINLLVITTLIIQFFILFFYISEARYRIPSIISFITASSIILLLNYIRQYRVARFFFHIVYPVLMFLSILLYGKEFGGEPAFFVFFTTAIILHDKNWERVAVLIYSLILYACSQYFLYYNQGIFADQVVVIDKYAIYLASGTCIVILIYIFFREMNQKQTELNGLLSSLKQKNKELSEAYKDIEQFAYITSHDLKTPLRTINSFVGLNEKKVAEAELDNDVSEYLEYVKEGSIQMNNIITDILEYSRINQNQSLNLEWIDLNEIIDDIKNNIHHTIDKPVVLQFDNLHSIFSNKTYLKLLFQNLIDNGIKYNIQKEAKISIDNNLKASDLILSVKDNGIGIEEAYHEQIFDMFKRLHNSKEYKGTGIGLAICKKITQKLKGDIWLNSTPGQGSTFYVRLPINFNQAD